MKKKIWMKNYYSKFKRILATFKKNISKYKKVINEIEMKLIVILHLVTSKYNL